MSMYKDFFKLSDSMLGLADRLQSAEMAREQKSQTDRRDLLPWGYRSLPWRRCIAAIAAFIGGNAAVAREQASLVVADCSDYFFGGWLSLFPNDEGKIDPDWWVARNAWVEAYRAALCCGSSQGDWKGLISVSRYPLTSPCKKPGSGDFEPAQVQLLVEIASYLLGKGKVGVEIRYAAMAGAKWRSYDSLARALDHVIAGNKELAGEEVLVFLQAHHKRKRSKQIDDTVSVDGTFFINLLAREGLRLSLPEKLIPYYFNP